VPEQIASYFRVHFPGYRARMTCRTRAPFDCPQNVLGGGQRTLAIGVCGAWLPLGNLP